MIFALSTDDRTLHVFSSEEEAMDYAEGIDVEAGAWLFFGAQGEMLHPRFTTPNKWNKFFVASGKYELLRTEDRTDRLTEVLPTVTAVKGKAPLNNAEAVRQFLARNWTGAPDGVGQ